jgi:hypothetical protein
MPRGDKSSYTSRQEGGGYPSLPQGLVRCGRPELVRYVSDAVRSALGDDARGETALALCPWPGHGMILDDANG